MTEVERAVADLLADGLSNKQIAYRRKISPNTVDAHLRAIYRKMEVRSRAALVRQMVTDRVV